MKLCIHIPQFKNYFVAISLQECRFTYVTKNKRTYHLHL